MAQDTLLGIPAHTLHPQGVCSIRRAAKPLTAALPYRREEFTTLSTVSSGLCVLRMGRFFCCKFQAHYYDLRAEPQAR